MAGLLSKRSREDEPLQGSSPKRFHAEQQILYLLEEDESFEGECVESEEVVDGVRGTVEEEIEEVVNGRRNSEEEIDEVVNGVMRSLEEEIGLTCSSSFFEGSGGSSGLSTDNLMAPDMNNCCGIDVGYLLGASDDELGLPPSPLLNSDEQPGSPSLNESCASCLDFPQNAELKSFLGNWQFEDDFVDYTQLSEDAEATAWDIFSPGAFIDGDYSVACRLESAGGIY
ncbi:hypothetical protein SUGI_0075230 [Cryptomeria japonica]|uniref:uncharacterized protein LOC131039780 n=1 Tax=Cryptomeria japonica TaxID=3369 RepID=UPI002408E2F5|nr:uncharacterized protein LOC131039780 [Cryptomeria japonica]GLJ07838.1 hypothetical protein SUGI_0075230 [Cryptomeria japonica]